MTASYTQFPRKFGHYNLVDYIGVGGMGEVYLAEMGSPTGVTKTVAIKIMKPEFNMAQEYRELFRREAEVAINLNHGNIVQLYEFGILAGRFFIAMEYINGVSVTLVQEFFEQYRNGLPHHLALYIVREVAKGLEFLHRRRVNQKEMKTIVHGDLSPQNILVNSEGEIKIIDFGLAGGNTGFGKKAYMAPEQIAGQPTTSGADIFALGLLAIELLSDEKISEMASREKGIFQIMQDLPKRLDPDIAKYVMAVLNGMLDSQPQSRWEASKIVETLTVVMNVRYPNLTQKKFRDEVADALSLKNNDKIKKPQKRTPPDIKLLLSPEYRPKAPVLQVMKWRFLFMINFLIVGLVALVVIAAVLHRYFPSALENLTMQRETDARRFVSLDSVPPGALLTIDGRKMNFKTPARLSFSGDKSHEVIFELAGYQPCTVSTNKVSSSYVCKFKK